MNPFYTDYSEYLGGIFPGVKVQKISVDAGRSCPNRDGTIGRGGCIYCDNRSFTPGYCSGSNDGILSQIAKGKGFFARKYPEMKYLVYFQSYTFTHGASTAEAAEMVRTAIGTENTVGIIIGTRPDCVPDEMLGMLAGFNREKPVFIEFGAESSCDATLGRINRGHTWADTMDAVRRASSLGIRCGLHLIAGLPGETLADAIETVKKSGELPIDSIKLHQLQIIKGTELWRQWKDGAADIRIPSLEEYVDFCAEAVDAVPRHIAIERFLSQAPPDMVEAPCWRLKNYQFTDILMKRLKEHRSY